MSKWYEEFEKRFNGEQYDAICSLHLALKHCDEAGLRGIVSQYGHIHITTVDDETDSTEGLLYIQPEMMIDNEIQIDD